MNVSACKLLTDVEAKTRLELLSLNNDQQVSLDILARICLELKCGFDDIVQIESVKRDN